MYFLYKLAVAIELLKVVSARKASNHFIKARKAIALVKPRKGKHKQIK